MIPCDCAQKNPGYYGPRCDNRDCVMGSWSAGVAVRAAVAIVENRARQNILERVDPVALAFPKQEMEGVVVAIHIRAIAVAIDAYQIAQEDCMHGPAIT